MMRLIDIYALSTDSGKAIAFLYEMLRARDPVANISHREMPSLEQHSRFVASLPYEAWYIVEHGGSWLGNIYLTRQNEIGVFLTPEGRRHGCGGWAVCEVMRRHDHRRYLANIAPGNTASQDFFRGLGFKLVQHTFELQT